MMKNLKAANQGTPEVILSSAGVEPRKDRRRVFPADCFRGIVLEVADEAFALLGKKAEQSIYSQLEDTFKIAKKDIPLHIEKFARALEEILGPGAKLLEVEMIKSLHEKVGPGFKYHTKNENLTFPEYLMAIRAFLSDCDSTKSMPNEYYDYKFC
jgi:hypothetical protein